MSHDMKYLVRVNKPKVAHIWESGDTLCRQSSTGGLNRLRYTVLSLDQLFSSGLASIPLCTMCLNVKDRRGD